MATAAGTLFDASLDAVLGSTSEDAAAGQLPGERLQGGSVQLTAEALAALGLEQGEGEQAGESAAGAGTAAAAAAGGRREASGSTCLACGIGGGGDPGFGSLEEQRAHFRTDWHRYNVRRRVAGQAALSEQQFGALLEQEQAEVGSLSGSESSDGGDDSDGDDAAAGGASGRQHATPYFTFGGGAAGGQAYAVWRCLVAPDRERAVAPPTPAACLASLQALRACGGQWAVIMLRGGHFAAAVFRVVPQRVANTKQADKFELVAHKSAHRYVVRAGQGGKQSAQDAGGKYARSAGSRLRRYNETALQRDVAEALGGWRELLGGCGLVLVHAPSSNGQQIFGGEAPLLDKGDPRVRRIPFTTRRPTFSETKRVMRVLVTLYEVQLQQQQQQQQEGQPGAAAAEGGTAAQRQGGPGGGRSPEEEAAAAAAAAAAEEEARQRKAEKRARQKARQKEERQVEAAASKEAASVAAKQAAEDEIARSAAAVAAMSGRLTAKPPPVSGSTGGDGKASARPPPRLSAKPRANEDATLRRARVAAAAEARLAALQQAATQQRLH